MSISRTEFSKRTDGSWGIKITSTTEVAPGQLVTVTRRGGSQQDKRVDEIIHVDRTADGFTTYATFVDANVETITRVNRDAPAPGPDGSTVSINSDQVARVTPVIPIASARSAGQSVESTLAEIAIQSVPTRRTRATSNDVLVARENREAARLNADAARERNRILVMGAVAAGHGGMARWNGSGELTHAELVAVRDDADLTDVISLPCPKAAKTYLSRAIAKIDQNTYATDSARALKLDRNGYRAFDARQTVTRKVAGHDVKLGASAGDIVLIAELREASSDLHLTGTDDGLMQLVRDEYDRQLGEQVYKAGDVTNWIKSVLMANCHATKCEPWGTYVPKGGRDVAESLLGAIRKVWGLRVPSGLMDCATAGQVLIGVTDNFHEDLDAIVTELADSRAKATDDGKAEIKPSKAATLLGKLCKLNDQIAGYAGLIGAENCAELASAIGTVRSTLEGIADDTSLRFAMLELDKAPDVASEPSETTPTSHAKLAADALAERTGDADPVAAAIEDIDVEPPADDDTSTRFGLLELN